jgi:hypothetical protein
MNLSENDKKQMLQKGISAEKISRQLEYLKKGFSYLEITKPAIIGNGIVKLNDNEIDSLISKSKKAYEENKLIKFVPASGAATRMFKFLYDFLAANDKQEALKDRNFNSASYFFANISSFAFYDELNHLAKITGKIPDADEMVNVLNMLILEKGLNYGYLPKGLLKFHSYPEGARTPVEEHLVEGALYASSNGKVIVHLTVSQEHIDLFKKQIAKALPKLENQYKLKFDIGMSIQKASTDSVSATLENDLFRDKDGNLFFRPGGHGALIENLNELDADIIFIKNIDNVVPDRLKDETVRYKKALAGLLLKTQESIFNFYKKLGSEANITNKLLVKVEEFLYHVLCFEVPTIYANFTKDEKVAYLRSKLNRPLRVCGMVKNAGEPGGGPFWAKNSDGSTSLQIVESSQIDMKNEEKIAIFNQSTHFNPVDLVCAVKDSSGNKFELHKYVDHETGFISKKSKDGKELKAIELPGLWNGAMSDWNTIFVEVPLITFNPVKTVNDLLRPEHQ